MTRPFVLVPAYRLELGRISRWDDAAVAVPDLYVQALRRAGAIPLIAAPTSERPPVEALSSVDGLLLIGGGDVSPSAYGGSDHPTQYGVDEARDGTELALLREAVRIGTPLLAICRGAQVVNAAFGGTLFQHLPDAGGFGDHGRPNAGGPAMHDVKVAPDSRLATVSGVERLACSSHHHQGIDAVGKGLVAVGWSDDGLVEAVEGEAAGWLLGVQWHPEDTAESDAAQQSLFDALVERAAARRSGSGP